MRTSPLLYLITKDNCVVHVFLSSMWWTLLSCSTHELMRLECTLLQLILLPPVNLPALYQHCLVDEFPLIKPSRAPLLRKVISEIRIRACLIECNKWQLPHTIWAVRIVQEREVVGDELPQMANSTLNCKMDVHQRRIDLLLHCPQGDRKLATFVLSRRIKWNAFNAVNK